VYGCGRLPHDKQNGVFQSWSENGFPYEEIFLKPQPRLCFKYFNIQNSYVESSTESSQMDKLNDLHVYFYLTVKELCLSSNIYKTVQCVRQEYRL
jgi:hypothetical protein